nr:DMT family transporter [Aneurinibacillus tyrosinisolvens]
MLLLCVVLFWGGNYTFSKFGMEVLSPEMFTLIRFAIVFPILLIGLWWKEKSIAIEKRDIPRLIIVSLVGISIYQTLFMVSIHNTSATNSSLMIALSPIFTGILSIAGGKEKFTWRVQAGSLLAFLGAAAVIGMGNEGFAFRSNHLYGDLIGLIAALFWGWYPILAEPLVKKYSSLRVTAWSSGIAAALLVPINMTQLLTTSWHWSAGVWGSLLYAAIPVTVYGLVVWYYGVSKIGPTKVMVYMYMVPLVAILIAAVVLHESLNLLQGLGGIVILLGITVVKWEGKTKVSHSIAK